MLNSRYRRGTRRWAAHGDGGFTLLEFLIAATLSVVVLAIAGGGLAALSDAQARSEGEAASQLQLTAATTALARDLRSADAITAATASSLTVSVNQPAGGTTAVTWRESGGTLTRTVSGGTGVVEATGLVGTALFTYSTADGTSLTATPTATLLACTVNIAVDLRQAAPSNGASAFEEVFDMAMTDRAEALAAANGGGCA